MKTTKNNFFNEASSFINNNKLLCGLTLGLAIVVYAIGNLSGRTVSWIRESYGTAKKTDDTARETFNSNSSEREIIPKSSATNSTFLDLDSVKTSSTKNSETRDNVSPFVEQVLAAYDTDIEGWVMVPPLEDINAEHEFVAAMGSTTYEGCGDWKIHLSIDPGKMTEAIPIVMNILHGADAPKVGFKLQTKGNLTGEHQIGKEFAIIFHKEAETDLSKGGLIIKNCLQKIQNELTKARIEPEKGTVLTVETEGEISKTEDGSSFEKRNYNTGKFDRQIPSNTTHSYFYYRDESPTFLIDSPDNDWGKGMNGIVFNTDVYKLVKESPKLAHNPLKKDDPYLSLTLD